MFVLRFQLAVELKAGVSTKATAFFNFWYSPRHGLFSFDVIVDVKLVDNSVSFVFAGGRERRLVKFVEKDKQDSKR